MHTYILAYVHYIRTYIRTYVRTYVYVIPISNSFGNQQWTWRNITVSGSTIACFQVLWNWCATSICRVHTRLVIVMTCRAMSFENINLSNCPLGK